MLAWVTYREIPQGLNCSTPGATLERLPIGRGYWRATTTNLTIYKCLNKVSVERIYCARDIPEGIGCGASIMWRLHGRVWMLVVPVLSFGLGMGQSVTRDAVPYGRSRSWQSRRQRFALEGA